MALTNDLISQFVKITKDDTKKKTESTVYGTVVKNGEIVCVKLDGSEILTPVSTTTNVEDGERVTVMIKDHSAIITGNISSPSARTEEVENVSKKVYEFDEVVTDKFNATQASIDALVAEDAVIKGQLKASEADISDLKAANATITDTLTAANAEIEKLKTDKLDAAVANITYATIKELEATNADIYNLEATYGEFKDLTTTRLDAAEADIDSLETKKLDAETAEITYASIENLETMDAHIQNLEATYGEFQELATGRLDAAEADINDLEANKLSAKDAELKYANIDFANINMAAVEKLFSDSGIIKDLIVSEGKITGELVGVTIKGDLVEAGTLKADRLVVLGSDGNYYKLNTDFEAMPGVEPVEEDRIHGSTLVEKSIVAEKIAVDDLVAFGATIGGFNITKDAIYSGAKGGPTSSTRGIYMDSTGQLAVGDSKNFLRYYKDQNGSYKLEISANSIVMSASGSTIADEIDSIKDEMSTIKDEVTTLLRIESSRGTVFKNDQVATVLSVVIYRGNARITDMQTLKSIVGSSAYLEWSWQHLNDESYGIISADDERIGNDGFTFTLSPADVDTKVTFMCTLNT